MTHSITDDDRDLIYSTLLESPAVEEAERERRHRIDNAVTASQESASVNPGRARTESVIDSAAHEFADFLDRGIDTGPDTDEFPVVVASDEERAPSTQADDDADELAGEPEAMSPPAPASKLAQLTERINWRHPMLWVAVASVIVIIFVVALSGGGSSNGALTLVQPTNTAEVPPEKASVDRDGPIRVQAATSHCPSGSSNPMLAFDTKMDTAWVCVRSFNVDGQVLTIDLGGVYAISQIGIVPGYNKTNTDGSDEWNNHRTVARVTYEFNDTGRTKLVQDTQSRRELIATKVGDSDDNPILASHVVIVINKTGSTRDNAHSGQSDTATDFAVSEVQIIGSVPE